MNYEQYLKSKGCSDQSTGTYHRQTAQYLHWLKKQDITANEATNRDILAYMKHCTQNNNTQKTIQNKLGSISHYYEYLNCVRPLAEQKEKVITNPVKGIEIKGIKRNTLYYILEPHELSKLYQQYPSETCLSGRQAFTEKRNKVILGLVVYQGVKTEELAKLEIKDVKVREGAIEIPQTRKGNHRTLKLESQQVFDLYDYLQQIRPALVERDSQQLFVANRFDVITRSIVKKIKRINPQVKNLKQIRASVITKWLKIYNLREVQYRAGHRYVSSTEKYKQNDLEGLQEEINQYHPLN